MNRFNSNVVVEINNRIEELDRQEFMIQMADFLSYEDKEQLRAIARERAELELKRKQLGNQPAGGTALVRNTEKAFGHILTHEEDLFVNFGRPRNYAVKAFRSKPYANELKVGGKKNGKNIKRGAGET